MLPKLIESWTALGLAAILGILSPGIVYGNTDYYRQQYFDNSLTAGSYFYSSGHASGSSSLELIQGKLPVESKIFVTPPNALRGRQAGS